MPNDEPVYAQCQMCQKIFRLEVLKSISVAGQQVRIKACQHCVDEADARSGIEK